jgi:hypothetical protein
MKRHRFRLLLIITIFGLLLSGCTAVVTPAPTATSVPPTDTPTVPPTATSTATLTPSPTSTPTATATKVPPTKTPTVIPTESPTATATQTKAPQPTNTKGPKPTLKPSATIVPAEPPSSSGVTSVMLRNTFPVSCLVVFWGPADLKLDASADGMAFSPINPGIYGWRSFLGGAETGEAGNLEILPGATCVFICDKETLTLRYGCK